MERSPWRTSPTSPQEEQQCHCATQYAQAPAENSEPLGQLHLLELLLLQDEGELGEEDGSCKSAVGINPVHVLQHHLFLLLAKTTHIWVCGQGIACFHFLTLGHHESGTCPTSLDRSATILLLDGNFQAFDGLDNAGCWGGELIVVAELPSWVNLAAATVTTVVESV